MNERIQELAVKAQEYAEWMTPQGLEWFDNFKEQFAELIIRECMNVLDPGENQLIARFQARQWLSEHFGVELTDENFGSSNGA
jgi:hypothetical protein